ncbi:MAG: hypothetical protein V1944_00535 [Candidatus Aenigmatarchaeota archaeon]
MDISYLSLLKPETSRSFSDYKERVRHGPYFEIGDIDLEEIEALESRFLKPDQTAFFTTDDGKIATPFHSSLTRLMRTFGLELRIAYGVGNCINEVYVPIGDKSLQTDTIPEGDDRPEGHAAIVSYQVRSYRFRLVDEEKNAVSIEKDVIVIDPLVESFPHEWSRFSDGFDLFDISNLVKNYPHNSLEEPIINFMKVLLAKTGHVNDYIK